MRRISYQTYGIHGQQVNKAMRIEVAHTMVQETVHEAIAEGRQTEPNHPYQLVTRTSTDM